MAWVNLPFGIEYLTPDIVNQVTENARVLKQELENKGYTVDDLVNVLASRNTQIADFAGIVQDTDNNIFKIEDVISSIYGEPWEFGSSFIKEDYQRWVLILNDMCDIIINGKGQWGILQLNDCTPTIDGKKIVLRGDSVGNN